MRVHLLAAGPVAQAVAARLAASLRSQGDVVRIDDAVGRVAVDPSLWPHADLRIVVAWRESRALLEAVDRSSAETGVPYTQAVFAHPRLRVGPTVVPRGSGGSADAAGGCQRCFEGRQRQHDAGIAKAEPLWRRYDEDATAGPLGYLPHHVSAAVALLDQVARQARTGHLDDERNVVRALHLLQGTTHRSELIPVHGCARCGAPRADASWADLAAAFGAVSEEGLAHV
ncbi:hypothetical protein GCM10022219_16720 [Microbacterium oryzae]|uniref:TOMM leader peptide-binding protein n=1 Tax=Microbacterium oryzae TaxID=743009 RepID=A0A6I6DSU3_9MICO|nr:hypothetical protein [Microbacterium oryzae]QGU28025.1 hypothetical protein D7D94_10345 [Microbacterium oryzae]